MTKGPRVFLDCRVQQALQVQPDLKATEVWAATEEQLGIAANPDRLVPQGTRDQLVLKDRWVQLDQLGHWDHRVTKERLGRQEMLEEMPNQVCCYSLISSVAICGIDVSTCFQLIFFQFIILCFCK